MTPADEIRAAAAKLRALATAAADDSSPGWRARRHFPDRPDSTFTSLLTAGGTPLMGGGGRNRVPYVKAPVGDYITTMDPTVGLALADWLDYEAALIVRVPGAELRGRTEQALAVARAINTPPPAPGQIWQDNDKRSQGRKLRIVETDATHATCELYTPRDGGGVTRPGRRTRIRLDRLRPTSTGYRYIGTA